MDQADDRQQGDDEPKPTGEQKRQFFIEQGSTQGQNGQYYTANDKQGLGGIFRVRVQHGQVEGPQELFEIMGDEEHKIILPVWRELHWLYMQIQHGAGADKHKGSGDHKQARFFQNNADGQSPRKT
mmetsp:Transcript_5537/g.3167  ORF Transcript_5537/g.3167 Transcript_5537/m.3167 type:complete len:126 (+) Transcript_5537:220-597(+)|eukprot:CAMPEP_0201284056 /NCGR_PEP_ID=MMETSP1317-20130820/59566_1 /ASSEMBLY_ACC=CAM_ASM_000770 /TAXON_ID=187299 /ORGANISM="Undescribed Undescribed, Strain Undescribed" /LENGTH=125 /DNA_ID=CAMNT_0047602497 /DNA_START=392 /DNA_END=769 /DNA_ORIENTATION=+